MDDGAVSAVERNPVVEEVSNMGPALREALRWLDTVDLTSIFRRRPSVMRSPPRFLNGGYRAALRLALQEIANGVDRNDEISQCRGWKLFLLLPRLLLSRPPRGGLIPKQQLVNRVQRILSWRMGPVVVPVGRVGRGSNGGAEHKQTLWNVEQRAESLVLMGEVSAGRHALEGAPLAPGTQRTLDQLRDPVKRPTVPYAPLPEPMLHHQAERPFELDKTLFLKNLKRARRGAAAGPSGVTTEHLKAVLSDSRDAERLFTAGLLLAQARIPGEILTALRMGRVTAPNGSVRGIVASDVFRRLVARTMAQQLGPAIERATSPFQYALSTRAGTECIAHAIQALTDLDPTATVVSIDG